MDKYIHSSLQTDFDSLYKARVLKAILFIFIGILTVVNFWLLTSPNISENGKPLALTICFTMQIVYGLCLLLIRLRGYYNLSAHLTVIMTALGVIGGAFLSGGPLYAPATNMNILPIIMAFVLINKQVGLIWTLIIICLHIGFILLHNHGFQFPQMLDAESYPIQHLSHWMVNYSSLIGLMFVFNTLNSRLKRERDNERKKFQHLASHDPLTNLANRLQFDENLSDSLNRSDQTQKISALFYIDLDGFKPINDSYGHEAGDMVLKEIGLRLKASLRSMDTVARLGGDEFGIILEDINNIDHISDLAKKILRTIQEPISFLTNTPSVSASIGISMYPLHSLNKTELMKFADIAMYQAKNTQNSWKVYEPEDNNTQEDSTLSFREADPISH
ncbi:MAG: GGDEF domain-containing protein [Cellvibrionales bacterium]|nr:GGDEF domain-containing protein [Cellvibrionales bacterium]